MDYPVQNTPGISGIRGNLFPFKVWEKLYLEYTSNTPLHHLMGKNQSRPIVIHDMKSGEGLQFRVGRLEALDYKNPVVGMGPRRGSAQKLVTKDMSINTEKISFLTELRDLDIIKAGTPLEDLPSQARAQLVDLFKRNLNYTLFNAMTSDMYANGGAAKPSYDRCWVAGLAPARTDYNALGTFNHILNGMPNDATSTLSTSVITKAKLMADIGGRTKGVEARIQPAFIKSRGGWPMNNYIMLCDPETIPQLRADALFKDTMLSRGYVLDEKNQPNTLYGSDYVGMYDGIHIYSCPDLVDYRVTSQDGADTAAWNLLIGAAALSVSWNFEKSAVIEERDRIDDVLTFCAHEMRGQAALRFDSKTQVGVANATTSIEQGLIHVFTRLS